MLRLNDKALRDAAGPLSAADMAGLFNPTPFGSSHESALQQIREDPAAAAVWESFRNIDPEKECRVLEKWEAYNWSLAMKASAIKEVTPATVALQRWSRISKNNRYLCSFN